MSNQDIIDGLEAKGEDGRQLIALHELNNLLYLGQGDIQPNSFIEPLVILLQQPHQNAEMILLSVRAFNSIVDINPRAADKLSDKNVIEMVCNKLLHVNDLDVVEQCLKLFHLVAVTHSLRLLQHGALKALLVFLEFLPSHVRTKALSTAVSLCEHAHPNQPEAEHIADRVLEALPLLSSCLNMDNPELVSLTCRCFVRMVSGYSRGSSSVPRRNRTRTMSQESFDDTHQIDNSAVISDELPQNWPRHMLRAIGTNDNVAKWVELIKTRKVGRAITVELIHVIAKVIRACPQVIPVAFESGIAGILQDQLCHPRDGPSSSAGNTSGPGASSSRLPDIRSLQNADGNLSSALKLAEGIFPLCPKDREILAKTINETKLENNSTMATSQHENSSHNSQPKQAEQQSTKMAFGDTDVPSSPPSNNPDVSMQDSTVWECTMCTYHNALEASACEICGNASPALKQFVEQAQSTVSSLREFVKGAQDEPRITLAEVYSKSPELLDAFLLNICPLIVHHLMYTCEPANRVRGMKVLASAIFRANVATLETYYIRYKGNLNPIGMATVVSRIGGIVELSAALRLLLVNLTTLPTISMTLFAREGVWTALCAAEARLNTSGDSVWYSSGAQSRLDALVKLWLECSQGNDVTNEENGRASDEVSNLKRTLAKLAAQEASQEKLSTSQMYKLHTGSKLLIEDVRLLAARQKSQDQNNDRPMEPSTRVEKPARKKRRRNKTRVGVKLQQVKDDDECTELTTTQKPIAKLAPSISDQVITRLREIRALLSADGITVHELKESGLLKVLDEVLAITSKAQQQGVNALHAQEVTSCLLKGLIDDKESRVFGQGTSLEKSHTESMKVLICSLQSAIAACESLSIPQSSNTVKCSGLKKLSKPLKVTLEPCFPDMISRGGNSIVFHRDRTRLDRFGGVDVVHEFASSTTLLPYFDPNACVEPLAPLKDVSKFLWNRLQDSSRCHQKSIDAMLVSALRCEVKALNGILSCPADLTVGNLVTRGPNWIWGNQDSSLRPEASSNAIGVAVSIQPDKELSVGVYWYATGRVRWYRWGYQGRYDIQVVYKTKGTVAPKSQEAIRALNRLALSRVGDTKSNFECISESDRSFQSEVTLSLEDGVIKLLRAEFSNGTVEFLPAVSSRLNVRRPKRKQGRVCGYEVFTKEVAWLCSQSDALLEREAKLREAETNVSLTSTSIHGTAANLVGVEGSKLDSVEPAPRGELNLVANNLEMRSAQLEGEANSKLSETLGESSSTSSKANDATHSKSFEANDATLSKSFEAKDATHSKTSKATNDATLSKSFEAKDATHSKSSKATNDASNSESTLSKTIHNSLLSTKNTTINSTNDSRLDHILKAITNQCSIGRRARVKKYDGSWSVGDVLDIVPTPITPENKSSKCEWVNLDRYVLVRLSDDGKATMAWHLLSDLNLLPVDEKHRSMPDALRLWGYTGSRSNYTVQMHLPNAKPSVMDQFWNFEELRQEHSVICRSKQGRNYFAPRRTNGNINVGETVSISFQSIALPIYKYVFRGQVVRVRTGEVEDAGDGSTTQRNSDDCDSHSEEEDGRKHDKMSLTNLRYDVEFPEGDRVLNIPSSQIEVEQCATRSETGNRSDPLLARPGSKAVADEDDDSSSDEESVSRTIAATGDAQTRAQVKEVLSARRNRIKNNASMSSTRRITDVHEFLAARRIETNNNNISRGDPAKTSPLFRMQQISQLRRDIRIPQRFSSGGITPPTLVREYSGLDVADDDGRSPKPRVSHLVAGAQRFRVTRAIPELGTGKHLKRGHGNLSKVPLTRTSSSPPAPSVFERRVGSVNVAVQAGPSSTEVTQQLRVQAQRRRPERFTVNNASGFYSEGEIEPNLSQGQSSKSTSISQRLARSEQQPMTLLQPLQDSNQFTASESPCPIVLCVTSPNAPVSHNSSITLISLEESSTVYRALRTVDELHENVEQFSSIDQRDRKLKFWDKVHQLQFAFVDDDRLRKCSNSTDVDIPKFLDGSQIVPGTVIELCGKVEVDVSGTLRVRDGFPTVCPLGVWLTTGKWFFEVEILKPGLAQIGFCDEGFQPNSQHGRGCGDDTVSWAFDGSRQQLWNNDSRSWGSRWNAGDVLGCYVEITNSQQATISFSLNGSFESPMGVAFKNVKLAGAGLRPALTFNSTFSCKVRLGNRSSQTHEPTGEVGTKESPQAMQVDEQTSRITSGEKQTPGTLNKDHALCPSYLPVTYQTPQDPRSRKEMYKSIRDWITLVYGESQVVEEVSTSNSKEQRKFVLKPCEELDLIAAKNDHQSAEEFYAPIRVLHRIAELASPEDDGTLTSQLHGLPKSIWVDERLTRKLALVLQDPLIVCSGSVPKWCMELSRCFPLLFPFEARMALFSLTSFGVSRALHAVYTMTKQLQSHRRAQGDDDDAPSDSENDERDQGGLSEGGPNDNGSNGSESSDSDSEPQNDRRRRQQESFFGSANLGSLRRQKAVVPRNKILESAQILMANFASHRTILAVEFSGETGHGLGPTLEFYSLVCQELHLKSLGIWHIESHNTTDAYVQASAGLFPAVLETYNSKTPCQYSNKQYCSLQLFRFMGKFIAKGILDGRLLDLPLALPLCKLLLDRPVEFNDLRYIDPLVFRSLAHLKALDTRLLNYDDPEDYQNALDDVATLALDFVVPGLPHCELKPGGSNVEVTANNISEYIDLVVNAYIGDGVRQQVAAIQEGINSVFASKALQVFTPAEFQVLLCGGHNEDWSRETVLSNIVCKHGYTKDSSQVQQLATVLSSLDTDTRRLFLKFSTGTPRLPISGWSGLNPRLTVVCKDVDDPDGHLPSCSTCQVYLKLPRYSSQEILKSKLLLALREGQGHFALD